MTKSQCAKDIAFSNEKSGDKDFSFVITNENSLSSDFSLEKAMSLEVYKL